VARSHRPKRWGREVALLSVGKAVSITDDDLSDAVFLTSHPGWSWHDLQATPEAVVTYIRKLDSARHRG
jgi:hypothetical protein